MSFVKMTMISTNPNESHLILDDYAVDEFGFIWPNTVGGVQI